MVQMGHILIRLEILTRDSMFFLSHVHDRLSTPMPLIGAIPLYVKFSRENHTSQKKPSESLDSKLQFLSHQLHRKTGSSFLQIERTERVESHINMNRSKMNSANSARFYALLFSALALAILGHSDDTHVTALPHPAVKAGTEDFRRKSRAIPEWDLKNLPKREIDETSVQLVDPSELQDKNETALASDEIQTQDDPQTKLVTGPEILSLTKVFLQRFFDRLDAMDKMLIRNTLPLIGVTAIVPFLQSIDLFWVNQLGDTLAVSAQSASNTLYQFAFGLISFIPSVTATLVSKNFANDDLEHTESTLITALLFGISASLLISMTIFANPSRYLGTLLKDGNPALPLSIKYMRMRCLSLVPQTVTYVCFGAFRGMLGTSN